MVNACVPRSRRDKVKRVSVREAGDELCFLEMVRSEEKIKREIHKFCFYSNKGKQL